MKVLTHLPPCIMCKESTSVIILTHEASRRHASSNAEMDRNITTQFNCAAPLI